MQNLNENNQLNALCRQVQAALPEYIENSLPTRSAWDIEKHLTTCRDCAQVLTATQATVDLLHAAPRRDTGDDFMARLHAELDTHETRRSWKDAIAEWIADWRTGLRVRPLPALSFGMATVAAVVLFAARPLWMPAPQMVTPPAPPIIRTATHDEQQHVALTASNPFDDPVAAHLEAQSNDSDANASTSAD